MMATSKGKETIVQILLDYGASPDETDDDDWTVVSLEWPRCHGHPSRFPLFLICYSFSQAVGRTALHCAASDNRLAIAKLLLQRRADVNSQTIGYKRTPLGVAQAKGHIDMMALLIAAGARLAEREHPTLVELDDNNVYAGSPSRLA